jgi:hypothetical protein
MGRAFGILCVVLGLWIGIEIFLEGTQNAFGGIFARHAPEAALRERTLPQRAGDSVRDSFARDAERRERSLPE